MDAVVVIIYDIYETKYPYWLGAESPMEIKNELECGQMPNVMVALPKTGGALCSTPQSLAGAHYWSAVQ